jgi:hypothetical protein
MSHQFISLHRILVSPLSVFGFDSCYRCSYCENCNLGCVFFVAADFLRKDLFCVVVNVTASVNMTAIVGVF